MVDSNAPVVLGQRTLGMPKSVGLVPFLLLSLLLVTLEVLHPRRPPEPSIQAMP